jgi:hypothetical protein
MSTLFPLTSTASRLSLLLNLRAGCCGWAAGAEADADADADMVRRGWCDEVDARTSSWCARNTVAGRSGAQWAEETARCSGGRQSRATVSAGPSSSCSASLHNPSTAPLHPRHSRTQWHWPRGRTAASSLVRIRKGKGATWPQRPAAPLEERHARPLLQRRCGQNGAQRCIAALCTLSTTAAATEHCSAGRTRTAQRTVRFGSIFLFVGLSTHRYVSEQQTRCGIACEITLSVCSVKELKFVSIFIEKESKELKMDLALVRLQILVSATHLQPPSVNY